MPKHLRLLLDVLDEPALLTSPTGEVFGMNAAMSLQLGFPKQTLRGLQFNDLILSSRSDAEVFLQSAARSRHSIVRPLVFKRSDGNGFHCDGFANSVEPAANGRPAIVCVRCHERQDAPPSFRDLNQEYAPVLDREEELRRLNWALAAYAGSSAALVRSGEIDDLMRRVCETIVEQNVYILAIVVLTEDTPGLPVQQVAEAGRAVGYLDGLALSWAEDRVEGSGPTGRAIRSGVPHIMRDALVDPEYAPWRARGQAFGIRSSVTVPFKRNNRVLGALLVYASRPDAFGQRELDLFQRLGDELVFAISVDEDRARLRSLEAAREEAQRTMRQERDFSEAVIRSLPGVLYMYDQTGKFLRWNRKFETVTGRTASEIVKMRPADFFEGEDRERVESAIKAVFETGEASVEANFLAKDGTLTPYYFTGVAAHIEGRNCLVGIGIDFAERKKSEAARLASEARYRALFEYAPEGIVVADPDGNFIDANTSANRMLGYEPGELIGLRGADIVALPQVAEIPLASQTLTAQGTLRREWLMRRKDGSTFPAEITSALKPSGNRFGMIRDMTERNRAEDARRAAEEAARSARAELARFSRVSTLGELVATIAHEINQPLAAIVTNSDAAMRWLAKSPPNLDEVRQALRRITRDSSRAHEIIKRTRAFLSRGKPDYTDVDINEMIEEIINVTMREQKNSGIVVRKDFFPDLPPARGNRTQLQQVLLNLVLNGMDAMRSISDRERILKIRTSIGESDGIMVSVEDTGTGLNPETADRLFEHFFTTKPEGTGLGLAISRSIIEAHGGHLRATARIPHGAIFQFTVPAAVGKSP